MEGGRQMSRFGRILHAIAALFMIAIAVLTFFLDAIHGLKLVLLVIQAGMTLRGLQAIIYYFSMARHMVGGKNVLFRGMIFLDLGILAGTIFEHPAVYILIYISLLHIFTGAVSALRANESRKIGTSWKMKMAYGITNILLALIVVICGIAFDNLRIAVWVYSIGLIYSSILRIISSFRKTEIVYIQ
jgi:hypothetical protein